MILGIVDRDANQATHTRLRDRAGVYVVIIIVVIVVLRRRH